MANDPVPVAVRYLQAVLAMIILGVGGFSIYAYFNMDGLIADGGIVPLIGCGVSVFGAFWALFAACSRNPYFHFGVAKFFLGGLIVIAVGSSVVAGWVCGDSYNTSAYSNNTSCNPASIASPEFTTGIVTAAFDGIEFFLFIATCCICARNPRTITPRTDPRKVAQRRFWSDIRREAFDDFNHNLAAGMRNENHRINDVELQML